VCVCVCIEGGGGGGATHTCTMFSAVSMESMIGSTDEN
jgi:hypothetical protein